ncbi:MAG: GldG family protein [Janthinobacterium lividum]
MSGGARRRRGRGAWVAVLAMAGLAGANLAIGRVWPDAALDLTASGRRTTPPGTRVLLAGLARPVTLRLFRSPRLERLVPAYAAQAARLDAVLRRDVALSHGMLRVERHAPAPYSEDEALALGLGLQSIPLGADGEQAFLGLAAAGADGAAGRIAFFRDSRAGLMEYDVARLIQRVSGAPRPVVGVMSSLPLRGAADPLHRLGPDRPFAVLAALEDAFELRFVATDAARIDPAIDVLMVAQAQHLAPATLYAIDQFVMRGGHVLAMVDPQSEFQAARPGPDGRADTDTASDLAPLLAAWGVGFDPAEVVGDRDGAWQVRAAPGAAQSAVGYVAWFNVAAGSGASGPGLSRTDPATAGLGLVSVASAGALLAVPPGSLPASGGSLRATGASGGDPGAGSVFTPFLRSGPGSALLPVATVRGDPDAAAILAAFRPQGGARVLGARVEGALHSAYDAPPPGADESVARLSSTVRPARLVVLADSDLLDDRFSVEDRPFLGQPDTVPFNDDMALVVDLLATLTGEASPLLMPGREQARPLSVMDRVAATAQAGFEQVEQEARLSLPATAEEAQHPDAAGGLARLRAKVGAAWRRQQSAVQRAQGVVEAADVAGVPLLLLACAAVAVLRRRRRDRPGAQAEAPHGAGRDAVARGAASRP